MWLFSQARSPFGVKIIKQGAELASPQTSFGVRLSRIHECVTNEPQRTSAGRLGAEPDSSSFRGFNLIFRQEPTSL